MKNYNYLILFVLVLSVACKTDKKTETSDTSREQDSLALIEKARKIHHNVITIDTHNDFDVKNFTDSLNYTMDLETQVTLPKMEKGGLDVSWLIVYTGQDSLNAEGYAMAYDNAMAKFNAIHRLCEEIAPDRIELALTSDDVHRIHDSGKLVAMIGVENAYPVGTDLSNIKKFHDLGARYMSLSHNGHSQFCDSNTGEEDSVWLHNGLSELGKQAITEMNKWGIMIDLSHPSAESNKQTIKLSKAPVIASHSSARALCNHSRNLSDEELLMIRDNGGVVQTVAFSGYVNTEKSEARNEAIRELRKQIADSLGLTWLDREGFLALPPEKREEYLSNVYDRVKAIGEEKIRQNDNLPKGPNVSDFADHIDYMVDLIGIDHVGISSDFDGGGGIDGWDDASETFNVTLELVKRGYTEEDIRKLWGGNLLRVLDEVQKTAEELQAAG
ncbi:dipeptidase [Sinomicrobium weinanense]|uniref:Dipeptidase n=1 Tax=Sinomicrobium weinanense TaxID=2842200 RepID=A0A926JUP5_9FLAO|nr:membrane dipeptidase [Sinomicrobium weinanense]MBC9797526.1 dipeptidase [Sinomicrobium weinanense]MBU3122385.1 dipeptidase [Sinomicrobium weinanense]